MAAAVFLHNTLFSPPPPKSIAHVRNLSTVSSSDGSHTVLSGFHSTSDTSTSYLDLLVRQPGHPLYSDDWMAGTPLRLDGDPLTHEELKWANQLRKEKKIRLWAALKMTSYLILALWTLYLLVRYFDAFVACDDDQVRRRFALGLGVASASCALVITLDWIVQFRERPPHPFIPYSWCLSYISSFILLAIALVNLILTPLWRHSDANPESRSRALDIRCHVDVDIFWTSGPVCPSGGTSFGVWLAASIARVVVTGLFLCLHHVFLRCYARVRGRQCRWRTVSPSTVMLASAKQQLSTGSPGFATGPLPTPQTDSWPGSPGATPEMLERNQSYSPIASSPNMNRHNSSDDPGSTNSRPGYFAAETEGSSQSSKPPRVGHLSRMEFPPIPLLATSTSPQPQTSLAPEQEHQLHTWVDDFRDLVDEVSRQTMEGMALERVDLTGDTESPPVDTIKVVGGVVRRMSTIESMGSKEQMSPSGSVDGYANDNGTTTRSSTLSSRGAHDDNHHN